MNELIDVVFKESPKLGPGTTMKRMRATGLYSEVFLKDLEEALEYADQERS